MASPLLPDRPLPAYAVAGATVLVPDWDSPVRPAPTVPAVVVRVVSTSGVMGGIVDVHVVGRAYSPDGGFRPGDVLAPVGPGATVHDTYVVVHDDRFAHGAMVRDCMGAISLTTDGPCVRCGYPTTTIARVCPMPRFEVRTTRRTVSIEAASGADAVDIFLGYNLSAAELALGPFPDFDVDPDGWRAHLARWWETRSPKLDWTSGECLSPCAAVVEWHLVYGTHEWRGPVRVPAGGTR